MPALLACQTPFLPFKALLLKPRDIADMAIDMTWHKGDYASQNSGPMVYTHNDIIIRTAYNARTEQRSVQVAYADQPVFGFKGAALDNTYDCSLNVPGPWRLELTQLHHQLRLERARLYAADRKRLATAPR